MNWKKIWAVVIVCMLLFALTGTAQAGSGNKSGISPRYSYTSRIESGLHISASGNARCLGQIVVYNASSRISMKVNLYQKVGNSWDRVTSWYGSCTGETSLDMDKNYQLTEDGTYKVLVTGTVTSSSGDSEWISLESDQITYP